MRAYRPSSHQHPELYLLKAFSVAESIVWDQTLLRQIAALQVVQREGGGGGVNAVPAPSHDEGIQALLIRRSYLPCGVLIG